MASGDRRATGRANVPSGARAAKPPNREAPRPAPVAEPPIVWEQFFQSLAPEQQSELLSLASRQGLVHAHQLPASSNGTTRHSTNVLPDQTARILARNIDDLAPVRPTGITLQDTALDAAQQAAVARAISATDVSLIQGLPGTGKSRVIVEILNQTAQRGERVLVLGRTAASADRILELVEPCANILALRLLVPDENARQLPPASRSATFSERVRDLKERSLQAARASCECHVRECDTTRRMAPAWTQLREIAERLDQLKLESEEATRRRASVAEEVERDPTLAEHERQSRQALVENEIARSQQAEQIKALRAEQAELSRRVEELTPIAEARSNGHWWTAAWWKARRHLDALREMPSWIDRLSALSDVIAEVENLTEELERERAEADQKSHHDRERHVAEEIERRRTALDDRLDAIRRERELLSEKWCAACAALDGSAVLPEPNGRAVRSQHGAWQEALLRKEQTHELLKKWVACLEESNPWSAHLRHCVHVVVAPFAALAAGAPEETSGFDMLILQEAEQFSEAEFASLARRARRSILVGEPRPDGFFERLWRTLHWDPGSLPYAWTQEAGRLCCRLRPVSPEHRAHLEREFVADYPDIELRILTLPRTPPVLAEVVFPPSLSLAEAKGYIFRELEELAVEAAGSHPCWAEEGDRIVLRFTHDSIPIEAAVSLEPGVKELLGGTAPGRTCGIEFDRTAGWDHKRAEDWVHRRLGGRDLGRTAKLDKAHRLHPHLAAFVSHVAYGNGCHDAGLGSLNGCAPRVEFVPVPALREQQDSPRGKSAPKPRGAAISRKGGAGLEIDLSDPRQRPRLPADVLNTLPGKGVVNLAEAHAILRWLQSHVAKNDGANGASVSVMAMNPAQVHLLRVLVRQSPTLAASGVPIVIDTPAALREREFSVALLSLTRSHSHRAIAFSDGPDTLPLALTRGKSQLVIFGDAGSLARRSEWDGPLEHLDEKAAGRERELVGRLVQYLEGNGAYPAAFRLCEVAGT